MGTSKTLTTEEKMLLNGYRLQIIGAEDAVLSLRKMSEEIGRSRDWLDKHLRELLKTEEERKKYEEFKIESKVRRPGDKYFDKEERIAIIDVAKKYISGDISLNQSAKMLEKLLGSEENITRKTVKNVFKRAILDEYIGTQEELLNELSNKKRETIDRISFGKLQEKDKKRVIFERFQKKNSKNNRYNYSDSNIRKKYEKLKNYILSRNSLVKDDRFKITEDDILNTIYGHEDVLKNSLEEKIKKICRIFDNYQGIGPEYTNLMLKRSIIPFRQPESKLKMQLKIAEEYGVLPNIIQNPIAFKVSPKTMYALLEYRKNEYRKKFYDEEEIRLALEDSTIQDLFPQESSLPGTLTYDRLLEEYRLENSIFSSSRIFKEYIDDENIR